ncbi:MAG TPA: VOC family protein [Solirubrobacteraceae bacterium]|jgi:predicted enzyme related to lactoylglutathione lyase|nr:VOC family protein [Solirubrobacteraceae bacterium]
MPTAPTTLVTGVDFVTVPTQDLAAAREFYADVLGLPCSAVYRRGTEPGIGAEYETGNLTLSILDAAAVGMEFAPLRSPIALRVDDVEAARTELASRGVTFLADTMDSGVCHMAHFKDPDGNVLMLHHRYAPRTPLG